MLIDNLVFFGGVRILSAALPFFILPIITSYLTDPKDFGIYDNYVLLITILSSLSILGTLDAMFREFHSLQKGSKSSDVIFTGTSISLVGVAFFLLLTLFFREEIANILFGNSSFSNLICLVALTLPLEVTSRLALAPSRLTNNKYHIAVYTIVYTILFYGASLGLLEYAYGYYGLLYGQIIALFCCSLGAFVVNKAPYFDGSFKATLAKSLLKVGLPLVPIFIIYWANNAIVRIFIVNFLGDKDLGVFALGSKYAMVSSLIQAAFAGGWSYFTFSTMNDEDQVQIKSKVFEALTLVISSFFICIVLFAKPYFSFAFEEQYALASLVFSPLLLAPLLLILYQIVANQFTILAKSYISLIALFIGFVVNVLIGYWTTNYVNSEYILVYVALSIPFGYLVSLLLIAFLGRSHEVFKPSLRMAINLSILIMFGVVDFIAPLYSWAFGAFSLVLIVLINRILLNQIWGSLKSKYIGK